MKCPKCGYHSFDHLESCKKCGGDLGEHKSRFGLGGFLFAGRQGHGSAGSAPVAALAAAADEMPPLADLPSAAAGPAPAAEPLAAADLDLLAMSEWTDLDDDSTGQEGPLRQPSLAAALAGWESTSEEPVPGGSRSVLAPLPEAELELAGRVSDFPPHGAEEGADGLATSPEGIPEPADRAPAAGDLPEAVPPVAESAWGWAEAPAVASLPDASPARRFAAGGVDLLILGLACVAFVAAGELLFPAVADSGGLLNLPALLDLAIPYFLVFFAVSFGYFTLFHYLTGQTPGKMLLRLRVEAADGAPLLLAQAFLRSVGGLLSVLAAGAGFLGIFFHAERRGWNDRLAGSRVVPAGDGFEEMEDTPLPEPDGAENVGSSFS